MLIIDYYKSIKNELINDEIYSSVKDLSKERHRVITYYNVGKLLSDAGKHYGKDIVGEYSRKLVVEVNKKFNRKTLYRMKQLYNLLSNEKVAPLERLLWSHYKLLIPMKDINKINYYIMQVKNRSLSKRGLEEIIKNKEYERLPNKTKEKLANNELIKIEDNIKNPILIKNNTNNNDEEISEKYLKHLILDNLSSFLKELGNGYTYVDSEYPINIGDDNHYIDILLYNIDYSCYVVVELKVTKLKKEHIGQIEVYKNYIDKHLKKRNQNKTIGILIVKENNKFIIKYINDNNIISREYKLIK